MSDTLQASLVLKTTHFLNLQFDVIKGNQTHVLHFADFALTKIN